MNNFEVIQKEVRADHAQYSIHLNTKLLRKSCKRFDPFIEIAIRLKKIIHPYGLGMCLLPKAQRVKNGYLQEVELTFLPNMAKANTTEEEHRLGQCFELLFKG